MNTPKPSIFDLKFILETIAYYQENGVLPSGGQFYSKPTSDRSGNYLVMVFPDENRIEIAKVVSASDTLSINDWEVKLPKKTVVTCFIEYDRTTETCYLCTKTERKEKMVGEIQKEVLDFLPLEIPATNHFLNF